MSLPNINTPCAEHIHKHKQSRRLLADADGPPSEQLELVPECQKQYPSIDTLGAKAASVPSKPRPHTALPSAPAPPNTDRKLGSSCTPQSPSEHERPAAEHTVVHVSPAPPSSHPGYTARHTTSRVSPQLPLLPQIWLVAAV